MAKVKKNIGKGNSNLPDLASILADMSDDLAALKFALENHQHTENTGATYAQNATVAKTSTVVPIKTYKES